MFSATDIEPSSVLIMDILSSTGRKTRRFVEPELEHRRCGARRAEGPELENPGGFLERRVSTISAGAGGVVGGVVAVIVKVLGGG